MHGVSPSPEPEDGLLPPDAPWAGDGSPSPPEGSWVADPAALAHAAPLAELLEGSPAVRARRARGLLEAVGLHELARSSPDELEAGLRLGRREARRLGAAFGLARGLQHGPRRPSRARAPLSSPHQVHELLAPRLVGLDREAFLALLLDGQHRLLRVHTVSIGTLTRSLVHPREVFRPAIRAGAAALLAAHNHPSGDPEPSTEDLAITRRLRSVGELVGIPLLDHVVIAACGFVSVGERLRLAEELDEPVP